MVLRAMHLCSGYGGFELALRGIARTVVHIERDTYAAAVLVERMAQARLDQAPVWSELATFDGFPWRRRVDLVTAGFPCQPFSDAGHRRGVDDHRWLWPDIARVIGEVGPRYVFVENVPGLVRHGLPEVLHSLAQLGFDAEWGLLPAAAVGAPHRRERFWLVAHADQSGRSEVGPYRGGQHHLDRCGGAAVESAADGERQFPPGPNDDDGWRRWITEGGPEPGIRRSTDGAPGWLADALYLGGNGLVPQCARTAWDLLCKRGGWLT